MSSGGAKAQFLAKLLEHCAKSTLNSQRS